MKSLFSLLLVMGTSLLLIIATTSPVEAKRLGGGSSFGSKLSHNNKVKNTPDKSSQSSTTPTQKQNNQLKQTMSNKGGMMGILGGIAIGGLLGAMFFGGAFENINLFDIVLFSVIAFVLFKLLSGMKRRPQVITEQGPVTQEFAYEQPVTTAENTKTSPHHSADDDFPGVTLNELRSEISKDFDKENFLEGAKSCYARLQNAWDEGDAVDIRQFTTDHVFAEIQDQLRERDANSNTKIMALNAELISARQLGEAMEATVLFEVQLIEDDIESSISEVWHFVRPAGSLTTTWYLDGIQQVETQG